MRLNIGRALSRVSMTSLWRFAAAMGASERARAHGTRAAANGSASSSVSLDIGHVVFTLWKVAGGLIYVQAIRSSCATLYYERDMIDALMRL